MTHFGSKLRQVRLDCGLSQGQLAKRLDISKAAVSNIEGSSNIEEATVRRYAEALGVSVELLLRACG